MKSPQSIIKKPLLTEKTAKARETGGAALTPAEGEDFAQKITFEVDRTANKIEIRKAIEKLFNVNVADVHTMIARGKTKRVGRYTGQGSPRKKAIVTLKPGQTIDFFEGV